MTSRPASLRRTVRRGVTVAGAPVGILCIEGMTGLWPGNILNATTFPFPVRYEILKGVTFQQIARGDESVVAEIVRGAQALVAQGARAIAGACGSFGHYQRAVANAVDVPVFTSILTQLPFVLQSLGAKQRVVVIFADTVAYTEKIRDQCGIPNDPRIVPVGLTHIPEFWRMAEPEIDLDLQILGNKFADEIAKHVDDRTAALFLQCSDLPPFAAHFQRRFGVPVFDMTGLIHWLHDSVIRKDFDGYL